MKGADLILLNRDKEFVVNQMEDFDFEERIAVINEIMNAEPVQVNLKYIKIRSEPCKSFFGFPITATVSSYRSTKCKLLINTKITQEKRQNREENLAILTPEQYFGLSEEWVRKYQNKQQEVSRQFKCDLWITDLFPINRSTILTVLKILSASGDIKALQQIQECLSNEDLINICSENGFPIKI